MLRAGGTGCADNAAAALLPEDDAGVPGDGEVSLEVDGDDGVPLFFAHVEDHAVAEDAGVVDEDVERPKVSRACWTIASPSCSW